MSPFHGSCKSCNRPVIWCRTANAKKMPVDPDPAPNGNVEVTEVNGIYLATVHAQRPFGLDAPLHLSHFVTCPNADSHRKR